jgi:HAD superfamily hydrolase (TIGR01509 family)
VTEAIFWDNDGILVDTERLYFDATRQTLERAGVALTQSEYVRCFMIQSAGLPEIGRIAGLTEEEIERVREERDALYTDLIARTPLVMPDVEDVLKRLYGKYVMGIVSSSYRYHFDLIHRSSGLLPYFDFTLTGEDCTAVKPHPDPYLKAIVRSGVDPASCLAIEDTERGLRAAKAAGVRCVVLPSTLADGCNFRDADAVLSRLSDVMDLL